MTRQETFDIVVAALIQQGRPSVSSEGCMYRGDGDLKCAVGHLIPDDKYTPYFEGLSCLSENLRIILHDAGHDLDIVSDLQYAHDVATCACYDLEPATDGQAQEWLKDFCARAREVAESRGLNMTVLSGADS